MNLTREQIVHRFLEKRKRTGLCRQCSNMARPNRSLCEKCAKLARGVTWRNYLRRQFGITPQEYKEKLKKQKHKCKICGKQMRGKRKFHLDHDHRTGTMRDFLCDLCNKGLGQFRENATLLRAAASYLESWGELVKI